MRDKEWPSEERRGGKRTRDVQSIIQVSKLKIWQVKDPPLRRGVQRKKEKEDKEKEEKKGERGRGVDSVVTMSRIDLLPIAKG